MPVWHIMRPGQYADLKSHAGNPLSVAHEVGHTFGLDDFGGLYYSEEGVMDYDGPYEPSRNDLINVIKYSAKNDGNVIYVGGPDTKIRQYAAEDAEHIFKYINSESIIK